MKFRMYAMFLALFLASGLVFSSCGDDDSDAPTQLKIGYLGDYAGWSVTQEMRNVVELAVEQINEAGGVNGKPVILVAVDAGNQNDEQADGAQGIIEANRLIEAGVSAFVGPSRSAIAEPIATDVAGAKKVPFISPGSTRTSIRHAEDMDFMFRLALPDSAQGKVLADLIYTDDGISTVSILYEKGEPYATGLRDDFKDNYEENGGTVTESKDHDMADTLKSGEALVVIGFQNTINALESVMADGKFQKYYFTDSAKVPDFLGGLDPGSVEGSKGTGPAELAMGIKDAFKAKYGRDPLVVPFLSEAYDATVAIALAAQMAGSADGTAVRDNLRSVTSEEGEKIGPGVESLTKGLMLAGDGSSVNYDGASGSIDWDRDGEICRGTIDVWTYSGGAITTVSSQPTENPDSAIDDEACVQAKAL